jgi:hypothetical protein
VSELYQCAYQIIALFGFGMLFVCIAGMHDSRPLKHHNEKEPPSTPKPNFNPPPMSKDEHKCFLKQCLNSPCGKMFIKEETVQKIKSM